jgi:hypothetical protein
LPVKYKLGEMRLLAILPYSFSTPALDEFSQFAFQWHTLRLASFGVLRLEVDHVVCDIGPAERLQCTFAPAGSLQWNQVYIESTGGQYVIVPFASSSTAFPGGVLPIAMVGVDEGSRIQQVIDKRPMPPL